MVLSVYPFFFYCYGDHRALHSFPTRRSSDLGAAIASGAELPQLGLGGSSANTSLVIAALAVAVVWWLRSKTDRKSTRLNSSHVSISYAVFCLKKKKWNGKTISFQPHSISSSS